MSFGQAIATCCRKYATFSGRASRPEFWWFFLFCYLVDIALGIVSAIANTLTGNNAVGRVISLAILGLLLPQLAVSARRMHDRDKTGWWLLLPFGLQLAAIPVMIAAFFGGILLTIEGAFDDSQFDDSSFAGGMVIIVVGLGLGLVLLAAGFITYIVWMSLRGTPGTNRFGPGHESVPWGGASYQGSVPAGQYPPVHYPAPTWPEGQPPP